MNERQKAARSKEKQANGPAASSRGDLAIPKASKAERGRPSKYSEEIAAEVCSRLSVGETLSQICRSEHMPARPTILLWALENREVFSDRYARARDMCLEAWADEVVEIADDGTNDWMAREGKDSDPGWSFNGEHSQRSRLRVDSRKWLLSKLKPEKYGDKLALAGDAKNPIEMTVNHLRDGILGKINRHAAVEAAGSVAKEPDA